MSHYRVILVVALFLTACARWDASKLAERFETEKVTFDRLATLCTEDSSVSRIGPDVGQDSTGVSADRRREYLQLFEKLDIKEGMLRRHGYSGHTFFIVNASGLPSGGCMYGYAYCTGDVAPLVDRIFPEQMHTREMQFQRLSNQWYLF